MGICEKVVHKAVEEFVRKNFLFGENGVQSAQGLFLTHLLKLSHPEP